jgi:hypothetical protein
MPNFLLNLRYESGQEPFIISCSIVGQTQGYRGLIRRFKDIDAVLVEIRHAGIAPKRYMDLIPDILPGAVVSFTIDLNEAQKLSLIQTDSSE